jgi:spastin
MGPIRQVPPALLRTLRAEDVRPISEEDFGSAVGNIRPSVSPASLDAYQKWSDSFGTVR